MTRRMALLLVFAVPWLASAQSRNCEGVTSEACVLAQIRDLLQVLVTRQDALRRDVVRLEEYRYHLSRIERLEDRIAQVNTDLSSLEESKAAHDQESGSGAASGSKDPESEKQLAELNHQLEARLNMLRRTKDDLSLELSTETEKAGLLLKELRGGMIAQ